MSKKISIDLNYPNPSNNTIGDLIVSPFIAPNAQIDPTGPDNLITEIRLTISGHDGSGATLSLDSGAPAGFTLNDNNGVYFLQGPGGLPPSNADWSKALDAIKGDSPDKSGSFNVTAQAFDGVHAISGKAHDKIFVCFMAGSSVATPHGPRAVESLEIGDLVSTVGGPAVPIRWIGRQTVSRLFADPVRTLPIRVKASALEDSVPSRDLLVSPDHALLIDGVLIHAGALVNGSSIIRDYDAPHVFTYYHIELADHSLLLVENTPAETFIDNVDRLVFDNWKEHEALYGDSAAIIEMNCPRAKAARQVPVATRTRLAARAGRLYPEFRANVA